MVTLDPEIRKVLSSDEELALFLERQPGGDSSVLEDINILLEMDDRQFRRLIILFLFAWQREE